MAKIVQGSQTFAKTIELLSQIADRDNPPTLHDLLNETTHTRPTLYRLLASLEAQELIKQTTNKQYILGFRLLNMARKSLFNLDIRDVAKPHLEILRDQVGETVHLAVKSGLSLVYIDKIESKNIVRMGSTIGTLVPFHSSSVGKAFLAALTIEERQEIMHQISYDAITQYTRTDMDAVMREVLISEQQGYNFDDQENEVGIACFGAAITNDANVPIAAVSVSVPIFRLENKQKIVTVLKTCTEQISKQMQLS